MDNRHEQNPQGGAGANGRAIFSTPTAPTTSQSQPQGGAAHPFFANHPSQTFNTGAGDIVIGGGQASKPKRSKVPLVIGAVAVILVIIAVIIVLAISKNSSRPKGKVSPIGEMNTTILYDETAPIPAPAGDSYGYISAENGSWLIDARYAAAERFYGDYAIGKKGSNGIISSTNIINRSGETIITLEGDSTTTYYDIENNYWSVDGDLYDSNLQKISPEGTFGKYIGNGYMLVSEASRTSSVVFQNSEGSEGGRTDSGTDMQGTNQYLAKVTDSNSVYRCKEYCSALTINLNDIVYAVVQTWGQGTSIINLTNGGTSIYSTTRNAIVVRNGNLAERDGNTVQYIKIQDDKVTKTSQPPTAAIATISDAGTYIVKPCEDSEYSIATIDGADVTKCEIRGYIELSLSLYKAYQNIFAKAPILIQTSNELQLFDMKTKKTISIYDGQSLISFEDSPFILVQNYDNDESYVCNILKNNEKDGGCISFPSTSLDVEGYSNYIVIHNEEGEHWYNATLGEIK